MFPLVSASLARPTTSGAGVGRADRARAGAVRALRDRRIAHHLRRRQRRAGGRGGDARHSPPDRLSALRPARQAVDTAGADRLDRVPHEPDERCLRRRRGRRPLRAGALARARSDSRRRRRAPARPGAELLGRGQRPARLRPQRDAAGGGAVDRCSLAPRSGAESVRPHLLHRRPGRHQSHLHGLLRDRVRDLGRGARAAGPAPGGAAGGRLRRHDRRAAGLRLPAAALADGPRARLGEPGEPERLPRRRAAPRLLATALLGRPGRHPSDRWRLSVRARQRVVLGWSSTRDRGHRAGAAARLADRPAAR